MKTTKHGIKLKNGEGIRKASNMRTWETDDEREKPSRKASKKDTKDTKQGTEKRERNKKKEKLKCTKKEKND